MDAIEAFIRLPVNTRKGAVERTVKTKYAKQMIGYQLKLIVLPPGTYEERNNQRYYNWISYSWANGDTSVYNDRAAIYADNQLHEIGNNFGLGNAAYKDKENGDTSNMVSRIF
jgi:hypothetical protein